MNGTDLIAQLRSNLPLAIFTVLTASVLLFLLFRHVIARGIVSMATRSATRYDDILVRYLRPSRMAWLAPLLAIYAAASLFASYQDIISKVTLFLILWILVITVHALLSAANVIYESRPSYNGVSIQSYLDIAKLVFLLVGVILSVSLVTGESPVMLLTGLGAIAAVLMLIFQSTILSLVASIQIAANDLIKEGDWVAVPGYEAEGDVMNITLHTIKIRNADMTYSIIPTYKIVDTPYRNWRGMIESGGRRIQRSLLVDMVSIKFCTTEMLERLSRIDLLCEYMEEKMMRLQAYQQEHADHYDFPLDGPQMTNIEVFRTYIIAYLKNRPDIYTEGRPFMVRALAPSATGLPVEIYAFVKTTNWGVYESIQGEIFDHLLAAASYFDLRVFQEPTGLDFATFAHSVAHNGASHLVKT